MERRRKHLRRVRGARAITAMIAALAVSAFVPAMAFGQDNLVNDLVKGVQGILGGGGGGGGGGDAVEPAAGSPPDYTPPLHGQNPHGQGTAAVIDVTPDDQEPLGGDPTGGEENCFGENCEEVVVGRTRGEQQADGSYHGKVVILALGGNEIVEGPETNEGETADGPLQPLQDGLDELCTGSGGNLCVTLLEAHSETTSTGSSNSFRAAGVQLGSGTQSISASAASSNGNISEGGGCQTAHGDSEVADANVGGAITAGVAESSSTTTACNNGETTKTRDSRVIELNDMGVPVPEPGCADGTADSNFTPLNPLLSAVCNADDNGHQAPIPYGVREALSVFVLNVVGGQPLVKLTTAAAESAARPPGGEPPNGRPPTGPPEGPGPDDRGPGPDGDRPDEGPGPAGPAAQPGGGELAFTGANLAVLGLIGGALMLGGVMLARASTRRHRRATV